MYSTFAFMMQQLVIHTYPTWRGRNKYKLSHAHRIIQRLKHHQSFPSWYLKNWVHASVSERSTRRFVLKHTQRQTHGAGMVVNSGRIMGRVFLARCNWCLQGDRTDGGMGASAAQLTLSVWGLCMCAASYTRETPCDFPEACGRRPLACVCLCLHFLPFGVYPGISFSYSK